MNIEQRIGSETRVRTSPAIHFLRPVFLVITALVVYGLAARHVAPLVAAIVLVFLAVMPAVVLHTNYRRKREQREGIRCG